jgi:threonylcarbamoyladenosine tRNA methylthiotransferase MtaB
LKRMKRRHRRADTLAFCAAVRALRPDAAFGADLIAGFPTETEAMFQNTLALVDEAGLTGLHVFPFSPRPGTPAAKMPAQRPGVAKERAARLRAKGNAALEARHLAMMDSMREILVENGNVGHTPCFTPIRFEGDALRGSLASVRVTGLKDGKLTGSLAA